METIRLKAVKNVTRHWWLMLFAGVLLIGLGVWVIIAPVDSYLSLSMTFAVGMVLAGLFEVMFSITNYKHIQGWGWTLAGGMIDLFLGAYLLYYPLLTMIVLPLIIGFWMLFRGFMAIGSSIELRAYGMMDWGWLMFTGIMIIVVALIILGNPLFGIINIIIWTALAFIISGIFRIYLALKLREFRNKP